MIPSTFTAPCGPPSLPKIVWAPSMLSSIGIPSLIAPSSLMSRALQLNPSMLCLHDYPPLDSTMDPHQRMTMPTLGVIVIIVLHGLCGVSGCGHFGGHKATTLDAFVASSSPSLIA
ncbi:hypothetical protein EDD85DRAFT_958120 [Armillaria nabsnona]|nr:hypothetical protein EDD85DRAFT_958120 [Armillaria nabsnona]